jgi:hypothetical protein
MALDGSSSYVAPNNLTEPSDSLPIFDVQQVQLQFPIAADFVAAQVANNVLILALSTGRILRIDLDTPEDIDGQETAQTITPAAPYGAELTYISIRNRYRPSQEVFRDRFDSTYVPGPFGVSSDHHHHARRELLPPYSVAPAQGFVSVKGRLY